MSCQENCEDKGELCSCLRCPCQGCVCADLEGLLPSLPDHRIFETYVGGMCAKHGIWEGTLGCPRCSEPELKVCAYCSRVVPVSAHALTCDEPLDKPAPSR